MTIQPEIAATRDFLASVDATESLGLLVTDRPAPEGFDGVVCRRFEFNSRGDRVPGRLLLPTGPGPHPLILLQHGAGGHKDSPSLEMAAPWVAAGAAVATIDFPLHGERHSPKFSEKLLGALSSRNAEDELELDSRELLLVREFVRQSVYDLGRVLDCLESLDDIDGSRVAFAGLSLGGILGAIFCGSDSRPRAAALALAGGGKSRPELDPCSYVAGISPRPLLLIEASNDAVVSAARTAALFEAAAEPKRHERFEATHDQLPGIALKSIWQFLADAIELERAA